MRITHLIKTTTHENSSYFLKYIAKTNTGIYKNKGAIKSINLGACCFITSLLISHEKISINKYDKENEIATPTLWQYCIK